MATVQFEIKPKKQKPLPIGKWIRNYERFHTESVVAKFRERALWRERTIVRDTQWLSRGHDSQPIRKMIRQDIDKLAKAKADLREALDEARLQRQHGNGVVLPLP